MIYIEEKLASKIPGETSLFISCDYNANVINIIKKCDAANYDKKNKIWECPTINLSYLLDNLCMIDDIKLKCLKDKKKRDKKIKNEEIGPFKTTPYEYQLEGIKYGLENDNWLLLDAPGLGKTLQIIYLAQELKKKENIEHCLIICGVNTLKTNWKKEIQKHSDLSCRILGERISKKGNVSFGQVKDRLEELKHPIKEFIVITNIETIRNPDIIKELTKGKANKFDMVAFDEAHVSKNPTSIQGKNLLKIKAKHKIAMTGTILTNSPLDAYMPLKWIGKENSTFTNFKYFYCNFGGYFGTDLLGYKNVNLLKEQINNCSLRRTKDILDLPPKTIIHEFVDMNDNQRIFYDNIKNGIIDQVDKVHMSTTSLLAMVSRLRQATACPSYLTTENIQSSKIDRAVDLCEQLMSQNEKVVIFSVFKETLNILNNKLKQYNPLLCTGDIKDNIISDNIDKFQTNDKYKIILATTSKMGTGITLTAASYAIFIDSPWTQALCEQCEDRIHRIGSKNPVFIYYLWCNDTFDIRVKDIVQDKQLISDYVVDDECPPALVNRLKELILDLN